jgi:hypothetical protein
VLQKEYISLKDEVFWTPQDKNMIYISMENLCKIVASPLHKIFQVLPTTGYGLTSAALMFPGRSPDGNVSCTH